MSSVSFHGTMPVAPPPSNRNADKSVSTNAEKWVHWKVGTPKPECLPPNPILSTMIPRPTAWICASSLSSTASSSLNAQVSLLEGYNGASDRPPTLIFASSAIPDEIMNDLKKTGMCSLSVATERDGEALKHAAAVGDATSGPALAFSELGLEPTTTESTTKDGGDGQTQQAPPCVPFVVASSPIQMQCQLADLISLPSGDSMVMIQVNSFHISKTVLRKQQQTAQMTAAISKGGNPDVRRVAAKIEAELVKPVGSLGGGRFGVLGGIYHMRRPVRRRLGNEDDGGGSSDGVEWTADDFVRVPPLADQAAGGDASDDVIYNYMEDDHCSLGYNPTKQTVVPRCIGWISTYGGSGGGGVDNGPRRVPHISPYSFFADVGRINGRPMVAFAAAGRGPPFGYKDAQRDAEHSGVFAWNAVPFDLAVPMNYSAAELDPDGDEFDLGGISYHQARSIDAPVAEESPIVYECRYVRTVTVPKRKDDEKYDYHVVVGEVISVKIRRDLLIEGQMVDFGRLRPVARLGYSQEYSVVDRLLNT